MRGGDNNSATCEMVAHDFREAGLRWRIERGRRLVEQPDRARHRDNAGDGQSAALPRGKKSRRQIRELREIQKLKCLTAVAARPKKPRPELEVLSHGKRRLHCILVTEIVGLLTDRCVGRSTKRQPSGGNVHEPGYHAEQGRFTGAIAPGNDQRFTRRHLETDVPENLAAASAAGEPLGLKFHHGCRLGRAGGQYPENLNIFRIFGVNLGEYGVGREKTL